jgi:hypothetical protein
MHRAQHSVPDVLRHREFADCPRGLDSTLIITLKSLILEAVNKFISKFIKKWFWTVCAGFYRWNFHRSAHMGNIAFFRLLADKSTSSSRGATPEASWVR